MLFSLRPLLASSITTKPDLLPVGSLGLDIRPVAFCHRPSFCLQYRLSPFQDAEVALWSNHGRRLNAAMLGVPPQFQVTFLNPNLMALDSAPT
jgi:hypothetical protein